jgi:hypothetical protein
MLKPGWIINIEGVEGRYILMLHAGGYSCPLQHIKHEPGGNCSTSVLNRGEFANLGVEVLDAYKVAAESRQR